MILSDACIGFLHMNPMRERKSKQRVRPRNEISAVAVAGNAAALPQANGVATTDAIAELLQLANNGWQ